jgi:WD40 repeat protein
VAHAPRGRVSEIFLAIPNQFHGEARRVIAAEFSPDSSVLATLDEAGGVTVWDPGTGGVVRTITNTRDAEPLSNYNRLVALSPDGQKLAVARGFARGSYEHLIGIHGPIIDVWNVSNGNWLFSLLDTCEYKPDKVLALRFSPNSDRVILAGNFFSHGAMGFDQGPSRALLLSWELASERNSCSVLADLGESAANISFSTARISNGMNIRAVVDHSGRIVVWDVSFGLGYDPYDPKGPTTTIRRSQHDLARMADTEGSSSNLQISPQGQILAIEFQRFRDSSNFIELWALEKDGGSRLLERLEGLEQPTFSPDGSLLVLAGNKGVEVRQAHAPSRGTARVITNHVTWGNPMAISTHNQWLALSTASRSCSSNCAGVELFNIRKGNLLRTLSTTKSLGGVTSVAFSPDGSQLASGGTGGVVIWDAVTGRCLRKLDAGDVTSVAFSPDGGTLITGHRMSRVKIWNSTDGRIIKALSTHVVGSMDGPRLNAELRARSGAMVFSPDGMFLASAVANGRHREEEIGIWDAGRWELVRTLRGRHGDGVNQLVFSADGKWLASAGNDRTAGLWNPQDRIRGLIWFGGFIRVADIESSPLHNHPNLFPDYFASETPVMSVAFSQDNKVIAIGTQQDVRLHDVDTGRWLGCLCAGVGSRSVLYLPREDAFAIARDDQRLEIHTRSALLL